MLWQTWKVLPFEDVYSLQNPRMFWEFCFLHCQNVALFWWNRGYPMLQMNFFQWLYFGASLKQNKTCSYLAYTLSIVLLMIPWKPASEKHSNMPQQKKGSISLLHGYKPGNMAQPQQIYPYFNISSVLPDTPGASAFFNILVTFVTFSLGYWHL